MTPSLKKTPLWPLHVEAGGKMVPFAGYEMPVQYQQGVLKEHLHTRRQAGLFDVSHMGQILLKGQNPAAALEKIVPSDIQGLAPFCMRYTVLLNDNGGIIDDLMVTRWDTQTLFLIVNAARKKVDIDWIRQTIGKDVVIEPLEDRALLALQGPQASKVLMPFSPAIEPLSFMQSCIASHDGKDIYISRSGYTGEDGFEISLPAEKAIPFAKTLLSHPETQWIGLGARDSLRLEAGLCLYGQDLDEDKTPIEANLKWTVAKRRREENNFLGAEKILSQWANGPARLRVGLRPEGPASIRAGTLLLNNNEVIGSVTSGGFAPHLNAPIAMGYVRQDNVAAGSHLMADVRGILRPCLVASMPFIQPNYKKG